MKYTVDDLDFETASAALTEEGYGLDIIKDTRDVAYATIWTERSFQGVSGRIGGYVVGSLSRNPTAFCPTYTLVMDEHNNARSRMAGVLERILTRKTMR